jgi:hypothetical protein
MPIKSFLTKVGLVEEDVQVKAKAATPAPAPTVSSGRPPALPVSGSTFSSMSFTPAPTIDPAIQEMLSQSLQESKLSGFDYLKFISAVEETRSTGVPEDARFKMTFSTAKQLGVDKNSLLKSGQHYIDVLTQDETDFNADCAQYEKNEVQSRETKLATVQKTISDLNSQLAQLNQDQFTLTQELQQEKLKLESRKAAFRVTVESIRSTIKSNIDKINQYLQ